MINAKELSKYTIIALIKSIEPPYDMMDEANKMGLGYYTGGFHDKWTWSCCDKSQISNEELIDFYNRMAKHWNEFRERANAEYGWDRGMLPLIYEEPKTESCSVISIQPANEVHKMNRKPIICVDFDGVIHSYDNGWQNGEIYGDVVPGFFEWYLRTVEHFEIVIYSSRSKTDTGIIAMKQFIAGQYLKWAGNQYETNPTVPFGDDFMDSIVFAHEKPPAYLTIDDRAIRFDGKWNAPELTVEAMKNYRPWMMRDV